MLYLALHGGLLVLLAAVAWLTGACLARLLPPPGDAALGPLVPWCLGLGGWMVVVALLATLGVLGRLALLVPLALLAIAALGLRRSLVRRSRPAGVDRAAHTRRLVVVLLLAAALAPFLLLAASPPVSWDAAVYHLTVPRLYVEHGGFRPIPFNVYSNWPLAVELLYAVPLALGHYPLAKLFHFGFGLLTLLALHAACREGKTRLAGWIAIGLFLANPVVGYELRVAYVDLASAFFFLAAFLFLDRTLAEGEEADRQLLLAGVNAGLLAGTKENGIAGAAVLAALYLPRLVDAGRGGELGTVLRTFAARFLAPVAVLWAPWLVKAAWYTGNPFYPFFYRAFGGPHWSVGLGERLFAWQRSIGMGREPLDYLLLPLRVILAGGPGYDHFDGEIGAFWIVVLPLALFLAWHLPRARRALAAAGLSFAVWSLTSQQMRLLIPALPLAALAAGLAIDARLDRLRSRLWRRAAQAACLVAVAGLFVAGNARTLAAGYRTLPIYLRTEQGLEASVVPPVFRYVNGALAEDARILFLNTNRGFFCHRDYVADSFFEASQIADWLRPARDVEGLRRLLDEERITHVLVERPVPGVSYPPLLYRLLRDGEQATPVFGAEGGGPVLFALR